MRVPIPATPQHKVQVENPGSPATPAAAAKFPLDCFKALQHLWRLEVTFNQSDGIREISSCAAVRRVQDDRRGVEECEILIEPGNRGFHDLWRSAVSAVQAVRPNRDCIEISASSQ